MKEEEAMPYSSSLNLGNIPSFLNSPKARNLEQRVAFLRQDLQALGSEHPFLCTRLHNLSFSFSFPFILLTGGLFYKSNFTD